MSRWLVCLCFLLVGCTQAAPGPAAPTAAPAVPTPAVKAAVTQGAALPVGTPNPDRPGVPTVSAAATRAAQAGEAQPLSVVEWWLLAYRGGRGAESLLPLARDYSDQLRLSGGVKGVVGAEPDQIRDVTLRPVPGATADQARVEAVLTLTQGEIILNVTLTKTPDGWRISRVETTG